MPDANAPRGCLVLMERGASWPAEATRELRGSSSVVVLTQAAAEHHSHLWKRVAARCDELSSAGVVLTVTLFVCASGTNHVRSESRIRSAARLLALLPRNDSARLVLTADRPGKTTTKQLLQLAAVLLEGPAGTHATIRVVTPSSRSPAVGGEKVESTAVDAAYAPAR